MKHHYDQDLRFLQEVHSFVLVLWLRLGPPQGSLGVLGIFWLFPLIFFLCAGEDSISIVLHNATRQVFGHYSISG